jgi:hypothetical protein
MMNALLKLKTAGLVAIAACAVSLPADAALITNGDFEAGLTAWTIADQIGSDGTFQIQTGTLSPLNLDAVPAPPQGVKAAMTDSGAGGSHVLYQDFMVNASVPSTFLSFDLFVGNRADMFATPSTLDWATATLNQQARVDIVSAAADPFSIVAGDIVGNFFQTALGDTLVAGAYVTYTIDITALLNAHVGESLRLRFAEVDNLAPFQFGIDSVSIGAGATIPEPGTLALLGIAATGLAWRRRKLS